jgi:hypothetical protein
MVFTLGFEFGLYNWPRVIDTLIVTRWLNLNSLIFPVLFLSWFWRRAENNRYCRVVWWLFLVSVIMGMMPGLKFFLTDGLGKFQRVNFNFLLLTVVIFLTSRNGTIVKAGLFRFLSLGLILVLFLLETRVAWNSDLLKQRVDSQLYQSPTDKVLLETVNRRANGLLIVPYPVAKWPQLFTGKAVLLNPELVDVLVYIPAAATEAETILNEVYQVSLHNPLNWESFKSLQKVWSSRSRAEWQVIGSRFGASDILTPSDWKLDLSLVIKSEHWSWYRITN